jgi:hypothetical protein
MDGELSLSLLDRDYRYHKYRLATKNACMGELYPNSDGMHDVFL